MEKEDMVVYDGRLGINGTVPWLVDTAVKYDDDYSDEALEAISGWAKKLGFGQDMIRIPLLVKAARHRRMTAPDTLPLEDMQIDKLRGGKIGYSETKDYGEVEIREEFDLVLIAVYGSDDNGSFTAAGSYSTDEFMAAEGNWLETAVGGILCLNSLYDKDEAGEEEETTSPHGFNTDGNANGCGAEEYVQRYRELLRNYFHDHTEQGAIQKKGRIQEAEWVLEHCFGFARGEIRRIYNEEYYASKS